MAHADHALVRGDLTAVNLIHRQAPFKQVDIANEIGHEPAIGKLINLFGRADLQHPAPAHDGNAGCHGHRLFLVMRHHDAGHAH